MCTKSTCFPANLASHSVTKGLGLVVFLGFSSDDSGTQMDLRDGRRLLSGVLLSTHLSCSSGGQVSCTTVEDPAVICTETIAGGSSHPVSYLCCVYLPSIYSQPSVEA